MAIACVRALTQPANGTASVNTDGSFTYTPFTFQEGELVMADKVNLATNLAGVTVHASTFAIYGSNEVGRPESAIDGTAGTSWLTLGSDAANFGPRSRTGALPFIEVAFPQAVDVDELQVLGNRDAFLNRGPGFFENSTILAGEFQLFDESGAEIYNSGALDLTAAPHDGRVVVPDLFQRTRNAARTTPGVVYRASSVFEGDAAAKAFDGDVRTQWHSGFGAPMPQFLEVEFPADLAIQRVRIFGNRTTTSADFLSFVVEIFDVAGGVLFTSGTITVPADSSDTTVATGGVAGARRVRVTGTTLENPGGFGGISELEVISTETVATRLNGTVRRARFTDTRDTSFQVGISEFKVIGTTLMRREAVAEPNLTQLLPTAVVASSFAGALNPPENAIDDTTARNWYAASGGPGEFIELEFPRGVTVREIQSLNPSSRPDGFGTSLPIQCSGQFTLTDAEGAVLFDSGVVTTPRGSLNASEGMTIPVANASGTKRLRFTSAGCDAGSSFPAGFSEIRVIGHADVTRTPLDMRTKFQALLGREVHSTPLVANLTDDNGDGRIDTADVPDIVVAVETPQDQLSGEIKIVSGDDGRELATLGAPNQVSPWAEPAVGDLDGDGRPEVVAVYRAGGNPAVPSTQLIAFDAHGAVKWMSDANPMPQFALGSGIDVGAVAIANLDAAGSPEIVVGASVFSAEGRLMGDGRALGGTTGGTGLRSRIPAIADIDLDGVPELVAGPTAYRLSGGTLSIAWQRPDRLDGYVGIANLDDDPYAEVVIVANGFVYVLNHDGSDALFWNAPSNAPVPIPGGGQGGAPTIADLDGDGVPEIGVAGAGYYTVFDRQGRVRWKSVTSDRTSNATGATVFDLDGDGSVEVIYRDEVNLRIYRGADGVVLSKRPIGSSTWSESPVVADVDNDGHADLVVTSDTFIRDGLQQTGVYVLHDVANRWVRTRRIWNQHSYHVTNVNEDGSIPLVETPHFVSPELNSFRLNALVRDGSEDATDRFTYAASDGDLDSAPATVRLAVRKPNSGPRFTSTPIADAAGSVLYLYPARAADPDAGDILTFSLPSAPTGMTIDAASGLLRWTPTDAQRGSHEVVVKVHDVRGLYALQGYEVVVGDPIAVPNVVGTAQSAAGTAIAAATLAVGAISARHSPTVAVDVVLTQSPAAGTLVAPRTPVDLAVSLGPAPSGTVPDVVGQQKALAQVDIVAAGFTVGPSTDVFNATSPAGLVLSQTPAAGTQAQTGSPIALVVSQGVPPGDRDTDGDGFTGNQGDCNDTDAAINPAAVDVPGDGRDQNCNGADSIAGDAVPPAASINSPSDLAEVTMPTDITGTATDANFLHYTLTLAEVDSPLETTIGNGTTAVTSGVLGRLDPTLLENGLYRIRLIVDDVNGHRSSVERIYRVTGEAKVGVVALSFVDLKVPVSGTPITVVRSYDSRVKRQGDFGVGWTLDVRRGAYRHNRKPGRGWIIKDQPFLGSFLPCIGGTSETLSHLTEVRLSDREAYTFALTVTNGNLGITGACEGEASFVFLDGPTPGATLEILDGTSVLYLRGGDDTLLDKNAFLDGTDQTYDPAKVRLTTIDGRRFDFDAGTGLSRIEDNNGNTLSITAAGILHSSGKSIAFTRDALGRITRIVGPGGQTLRYEYTSLGDLDAFLDQADNRTLFEYDTKHNLQQILDPLGNRAFRAEYDAAGRLIAMTDARGQRLEFAHDLGNREETITDARGTLTRLIYDDHGFVQSRQTPITSDGQSTLATTTIIHDRLGNERVVVDADGRRTESTFDFDRILESIEDPQGLALTTRYTYDGRGEVLTLTNPAGEVRAFEYDLRGNLTTATEASGTVTRFTSDDLGQLTRVVDALGVETRASYDGQGNLIAREQVSSGRLLSRTEHTYDANGNQLTESVFRTIGQALVPFTTVRSYDVRNRLVSTTNPLGQTARIEYNAIGLVSARIDEQGRRTTYEYDEVGALIRTEFPDGTSQTRSYDEVGNLVRETDEALRSTEFEYDELNRQVRRRLPDGSAVQYVYSPGGRLIAVIDPLGNRIDIKYDPAGRRITTSLPEVFDVATNQALRPAFREEWDEAGRVTARIDPQGRRTTREYDAAGRLLRTIYADGTSVEVRYDALGRLIGRIDEAGRLTTFERDGLGRVGAVVDALGGRSRYEYDEAGNLVREVDAKGRTTRLEYDALNRQAVKTLPGGQRDHFEYDEVGSVASYTDFNGQRTRFEYDARGRLLTKLYPDGSNVRFTFDPAGQRIAAEDSRGTTTYAYDVNRRLVGTRQPTGETVAYTYDAAGRVTQLISPAASVSYEYDALNRLSKVSTASGDTRYGYDSAGALVMTTAANGIVSRFDYDLRGRLLRLRHARGNSTLASFDYQLSATGRRVRMTEADGAVETYDYDALERLVREVRSGATPRAIGYDYDAVGNRTRMTRDGTTTTFSYDENDRLLTAGATAFAYDDNGQVVSRVGPAGASTMSWDFEGRMSRTVGTSGTTDFAYDADGNLVERVANGELTRLLPTSVNPTRYSQTIEERDATGNLQAQYVHGLDLLSMKRGGTESFYQYDALGSTRLLTDAAGLATDTYAFDGYGNLAATSGLTPNPYLFTGERLDESTGVYDLRARNYDPRIGRFMTRDPVPGFIEYPVSRHAYLYAHADPVNLTDPSGQSVLLDVMTALIGQEGLQTIQASIRAVKTCSIVGKVMAFAELGVFAACAFVVPEFIEAIYDVVGLQATSGSAKIGFVSSPPFFAEIEAKARTLKGVKKIEFRTFVDPPGAVVAVDSASGPRARVEGFYSPANGFQWGLSVGANIPIGRPLEACGVEVFKAEFAARAKLGGTGLNRPSPKAGVGLDLTLFKIIKSTVPIFPPDFFAF